MTEPRPEHPTRPRGRMRNVAIVAGLLVALVSGSLWFLSRESTLEHAANYVAKRTDGRLEPAGVQGSLLGTIRVRELRYRDTFGKLTINDAHIVWRPVRLLIGQIAVGAMAADSVSLELSKAEDEIRKPPASLRPPISFAITELQIGQLTLTRADTTHELRGLRAAFSGNRRHLQAELKSLATQWGTLRGELQVGADAPFDLKGGVALTALDPEAYTATLKLGGSLMHAEASLEAKARDAAAAAKLAIAPYELQPLTHLEFSARDFDPRVWAPTAPSAALSGEGRLVTDAERKLSGALLLVNGKPGTIDDKKLPFARFSTVLHGVLEQLALGEVQLDLAEAGQLTGAGAWRDGSLDVKLATRNFNLRGVQSRLHKTQLAGELALGGNTETQRLRLALTQRPYQFRFAGTLEDGIAQIEEAYARAGSAQLTTRGRVALTQQKAFTLAGRLSNFDPAQFGNYPAARINSRFELAGQVEPVIQVSANVSVSDSRLFGLPATAKGTFHSRRSDHPDVEMDLAVRIGQTRATAKGTLRDPTQMQSMDMQLTLAGASLDELYKIIGVPLPATPPYRIGGRLVHSGQLWELRRFAGAVGDSDLSGNFLVDRGRSPQFMKADLTSNRLDLADLAGFVGAEKTATGKVATPNTARVLPDKPYNLEKLKAADADIRFQGKRVKTEKLPIDDMSTHLMLKGGVLTLAPLNFGVAGGRLVSDITLDGSATVIASRADVRVQSLQLEKLMPRMKTTKASIGELDGRVRLKGRGNSVAAMLGSANGDMALVMGEGEVSDLLVRLSNLDIANTLLVLMRGDRNIPIRCMVADLAIENGVMQPRQFVLDTAHTTLVGEGKAKFADETLELRLVAKPKDQSLLSLRGPIVVGGTFSNPSVRPDMKQLTARAAAAVGLAIVATPFAALVPFIQLGGSENVECGPMVQAMRQAIQKPAVSAASR